MEQVSEDLLGRPVCVSEPLTHVSRQHLFLGARAPVLFVAGAPNRPGTEVGCGRSSASAGSAGFSPRCTGGVGSLVTCVRDLPTETRANADSGRVGERSPGVSLTAMSGTGRTDAQSGSACSVRVV